MTLSSIVALVCLLGFCGLMLGAALSDLRSLTIPNRISIGIALLYPAFVLSSGLPLDWLGGLMTGGGLLLAGFVLFALGGLGGGDAKLLAAGGLWAGPQLVLPYLFLIALTGGVMALIMWLRHRLAKAVIPALVFATPGDEDFAKKPMPYAVAIATGALYVAFTILKLG
ncbi:MAG: prepilin peptidase [Kiloniellales bacterium]